MNIDATKTDQVYLYGKSYVTVYPIKANPSAVGRKATCLQKNRRTAEL